MADRLVAVNDADYRLPPPVRQGIAADVGDAATELGSAIGSTVEARTFVVDTGYASLEDALAATPAGGVLELRGVHNRAATFTVDKPCTIRFAQGAKITTSLSSIAAVTVTASDVTLDGPVLIGTGSGVAGTGRGISAVGALGSEIRNLRVLNPQITQFSEYGMYLEFCDGFQVEDVSIASIAYAGISLASCANGVIRGGTVTNIVQPSGFLNSYGITASRRTNSPSELAAFPRSRNIVVNGMTIDGVPLWEGLDTHGGENIEFSGNTVRNCLVGIAIVASSNNAGVSTYAPLGVKVTGNTVVGAGDGSNSAGIWFIGTATEYATGSIVDNRVVDAGGDTASAGNNWGGIAIDRTSSLKIAVNTLVRCAVAGIHVIAGNVGTQIASNVVEDVYSNASGICAAVYVRSSPNSILVTGTEIVRGTKTATRVNNEGIRCNASSTQHDGGGNQWSLATTPVVNGTVLRSSAYGAAPVARAAAITAPPAPGATYDQTQITAMKTALDAAIAALKNYGITL